MNKMITNEELTEMGQELDELVGSWVTRGVPMFLLVGILDAVKTSIVLDELDSQIQQIH